MKTTIALFYFCLAQFFWCQSLCHDQIQVNDTSASNLETLMLVTIITRHGSRSPYSTFVNDKYPHNDAQFWPDGNGQLTKYGKQQLFQTGRHLRNTYDGFIGIHYNSNETAANTNAYDRDYASAACLLAGLYPPTGDQIWNEDILWQPIPIVQDAFDVADLYSNSDMCPTYTAEMKRSLAKLDKETGQYKEVFETLTKNSGQKATRYMDAHEFYDTFKLDEENGFALPDWATAVFPEPLTSMASLSMKALFAGTEKIIRLTSGPVLKTVLNQMMGKAQGTLSPDRRMFIDAAHDATIIAVFNGLGLTELFYPVTSSYMVFELHGTTHGHQVKVFYYEDSSTTTPTLLNLPACENPCSLETFAQLVEQVVPTNWEAECQSEDV